MTTMHSLDAIDTIDTIVQPEQRLGTEARPVTARAHPPEVDTEVAAGMPAALEGELRHVDGPSVAKVVAVLAAVVAAAWTLGVLLCWLAADALGATHQVEGLARDLGFEGFRLAATPVFAGIALLGLAFVAACTIAALLATAAFNVVVRIVGGVRVVVAADDALMRSGG
jgi:hypothetical protein